MTGAELVAYTLSAIMVGVICAWIILLRSMYVSFTTTPDIEDCKGTAESPKISVILPARDEQEHIGRCLESLLDQTYENYEIIAVDDSSKDQTGQIIASMSEQNDRLVHVTAKPKPDGWMGKNWACVEGCSRATGQLLLFTDADTKHGRNVISLAVNHMLERRLDALTAIPRILALDFWTRVTLPMLSVFLHTRFSALRVNDPSKKTGYFFGSFFIIKKEAYESVGGHAGVKHEIIEDGALGRKVKEAGLAMRMVSADKHIDAVWARDASTLWHGLRRLMVPLYLQNRRTAVSIWFAVTFLLFVPFPALAYAALSEGTAFGTLALSSLCASTLIYAGGAADAKYLQVPLRYAVLLPAGGLVVVLGFLSGLAGARDGATVIWRGRKYALQNHTQDGVRI